MVEEYKLQSGLILRIVQDDCVESPRDWDNLGKFAMAHHRYNFGDINDSPERIAQQIKEDKAVVCLPVYMYDHSGLTISTSPFSCPWDSGQIGYIWASRQDVLENWSVKKVSAKLKDRVRSILEAEIKTLDDFLTGNVYGYNVIKKTTCSLGHEHEEVVDSCYGFYGSDILENGILDNAEISREDLLSLKEQLNIKAA